jgi:dephospho-CoA kinase
VIKIGLTGGYGSGKSSVALQLEELGTARIDADVIAHDLIDNDDEVRSRIIHAFGHGCVDAFGNVVRKKLAEIVFADRKKIERLNSIMHPPVLKVIRNEFSRYSKQGTLLAAVAEVPLLIETGMLDLYDIIIVVTCDYEKRVKRFIQKGGVAKEDFDARERFQMGLSDKIKYADYVVDNNGPEEETLDQVIKIWNKLIVNKIEL